VALYLFSPQSTQRLDALPQRLPEQGFVWWVTTRAELETGWLTFQSQLQGLGLDVPMDLHQQDLLNAQHPSYYDYTSNYDLVIFRRLVVANGVTNGAVNGAVNAAVNGATPDTAANRPQAAAKKSGPAILRNIATVPVGFLLYDRLLVTVHSDQCATANDFMQRIGSETNSRRPASPADLMLRMVNAMVDGYLELRKTLSVQLDHWQAELLSPTTRFVNWRALLASRNDLHALEDLCDEQHDAIQEWLDTLQEQPIALAGADIVAARNERDNLVARSRDVMEHIQRVVHHVRRMEQSAETAVQMHFSAQSHRANDVMRTLTAVTAIFLPLNLIAGIFGMNFEFLPIIHSEQGFWWALGAMALTASTMGIVFWRKRYLARTRN
jgi:magnesium transporter